jgi:hypothetical protein
MSLIVNTLYDCYNYVIGLYKGTCKCFDPKDPHQLDYNTSYSGLYLNGLHPLNNLIGLENCENNDLWELMNEARERAIINFVTDTNALLSTEYKLAYQPYTGVIGRVKHDADKTINTTYAGVVMRCNNIKSGVMVLTGLSTIFSYTGTVTLTIYDNMNNNYGFYVLNTVADTLTYNSITEIELPLYSDFIDYLEYYFIYTLTGQPRNNDLSCNCGSFRPQYNLQVPYYTKTKPKEYGWANYVMVGGVETDSLDFMNDDLSPSMDMNGLVFHMEFRCKIGETLCKDSLDFVGDPIAGAIAHAILYKAGFLLADMLISTNEINRQTMMNHEALIEFQKEWIEKYNEMIEYIVSNVDVSMSDCFICRDHYQIHRAGILA